MNIKEIAKYMVTKGIKESCDSNYIFYVEEIASVFNIDVKEIYDKAEEILNALDNMEEVVECSLEADEFYLTFFTDSCRSIAFYQTQSEDTTEEFPFLYYICDCEFYQGKSTLVITDRQRHGHEIDQYLINYGIILCDTDISIYFNLVRKFNKNQGMIDFKYIEYDEFLKIAKEIEEPIAV